MIPTIIAIVVIWAWFGGIAELTAQEDCPQYHASAITTGDPDVPLDELELQLKPMTAEELRIEGEGWFELLRKAVFELNQGTHHDHILCVKCGRVDEFVDETIEARQKAIAAELGYEMTDHCLYMYGICKNCKNSWTMPWILSLPLCEAGKGRGAMRRPFP